MLPYLGPELLDDFLSFLCRRDRVKRVEAEPHCPHATASPICAAPAAGEFSPFGENEILAACTHAWTGSVYPPLHLPSPHFSLYRVRMEPYATLPWHYHNVAFIGHVLNGAISIETLDGMHKTFRAGESIAEVVQLIHRAVVGEDGIDLLVFSVSNGDSPSTIVIDEPPV